MRTPRKTGFTLLEIIIALLLMSILVGLIGAALTTHLRALDASRTEVAEAQLARALLEKIARDIRNAVVSVRRESLKVDTDGMAGTLFGSQASGVDSSSLAADAGYQLLDADSVTTQEDTMAGTTPGVYGDLEWLQIDTARLPRGENFQSKVTRAGTSPLADRLSASKTVLYYLGEETGTGSRSTKEIDDALGALGYSYERGLPKCGLYRREMDRLATEYMVNEGLETEQEEYDELLAPEVEAVEFLYFDPTLESTSRTGTGQGDWVETWDTDENGGLPTAIRITIWIRRQSPPSRFFADNVDTSAETVAYSLIVPLPVVAAETEDEAAQASETASGN